jgi:hypothetical protein
MTQMASFFDTHITISAPGNGSAGSAPAFGAGTVVMSRSAADLGRTNSSLSTGATEALVVRCART